MSNYINGISADNISEDESLEIQTDKWTPFEYENLFKISKGKRLTKANMHYGKTPFIGAIDSNNGVSQKISAEPFGKAGSITVNYNGSVAEAFYQPLPYWASDDCNILNNSNVNPYVAMFLCTVIELEKYRFSYGRKWKLARMKKSVINLPTGAQGKPDWQFMEDYIKSLPYSSNLEKMNVG